jgi:hypothetical protein
MQLIHQGRFTMGLATGAQCGTTPASVPGFGWRRCFPLIVFPGMEA